MNKTAWLGISSNLGDKLANLKEAVRLFSEVGEVVQKSSIYVTESWGVEGLPDYFNACLELRVDLTALKLLSRLLEIEERMGRVRSYKFASRVIDLDIILFGDEVISEKELVVPHKLFAERRFVLDPLVEIAPDLRDPVGQKSMLELQRECRDSGRCDLFLAAKDW